MSVLRLNVYRLIVPNIISLGGCLKNFILFILARLLNWTSKLALFSMSGLKDEKLI